MENPYLPPSVEETAAPRSPEGSARRFSPGQVAVGTFVGGLLAAGWLLGVNEEANGKPGQRWVLGLCGAVLMAVVLFIELRIDVSALGLAITIASVSTAHAYAKQFERQKAPSVEWSTYSGWHVAAVALVCFVVTFAVGLGLGLVFPNLVVE